VLILIECVKTRSIFKAVLGCPMYLDTEGNVPAVECKLKSNTTF